MIGLALRLMVAGGREAITRLVMIALAVMLGAGMLLTTLAGLNAVNGQNARYAWLETGTIRDPQSAPKSDPLWWRVMADRFDGTTIGRIDVAATGPHAPVPPGIPRLPAPGEYYVSPAMHTLLADSPAGELADRYPGHDTGTIAPAGLPSPATALIVIGHTPSYMAHLPGADRVRSIATTSPGDCAGCSVGIGINTNGIDLVLGVVSAALLFPILIFIGSATRLSAARREQRFAAMRLVGATPRQIAVIAAVESFVATIVGVGLGFALFYAFRSAVAGVPFTGEPFYPSDMQPNGLDVVVVAVGIPLVAAAAARFALRRVQISPLGVTRRVRPRPPSAWRLLVMAVGLAELGWVWYAGPPDNGTDQTIVYLAGVLVVMAGLIYAGPWLAMFGARVISRRTGKPDVLIAARRLGDNPQAAFRAISGLVLALFVGTVSVGILTAFVHERGMPSAGTSAQNTMVKDFSTFTAGRVTFSRAGIPSSTVPELDRISGVHGAAVVRVDPQSSADGFGPGIASCADLARVATFGQCTPGATTARVEPSIGGTLADHVVWPASTVPMGALKTLRVEEIIVGTNGSVGALERARSVLERAFPDGDAPSTVREWSSDSRRLIQSYQRLAEVVILASLPIAGCSLAVSVIAGLGDRRRPFSLLRLAGMPLTMLRRVIGLESAVPMLIAAAVAIVSGFAVAELFLQAQLHYSLEAPGVGYYLVVAVGILASLAIVGSTLPFLARTTGPEASRND